MPFFRPDPALQRAAEEALAASVARFAADGASGENVSLTWTVHDRPLRGQPLDAAAFWAAPPRGASIRGDRQLYPASVVKLFYMVALTAWAEAGFVVLGEEDRRALKAMVAISSNNATCYVVDRLTGAHSGPELPEETFAVWRWRREAVERYVASWSWPEFDGARIRHKTYDESPYGLETRYRQMVGPNLLSTDLTARLVCALAAGLLAPQERCADMLELMARDSLRTPELAAVEESQVNGFLVEAMPADARVWSKAGWTSVTRHDAVYAELADGRSMTLVVFTTGEAMARLDGFLPELGRRIADALDAVG